MGEDDFEPLDPAPVVDRLKSLADKVGPHVPALSPDGPTVRAQTSIIYEDGLRLELSVSLRLVFPTEGES